MHRCPETASSASILHSLSLPADEQRLAGHHLHSLLPSLHCQEECHAPDGMHCAQTNLGSAGLIHVSESLANIDRHHLSQCAMHGLVCILRYGELHACSLRCCQCLGILHSMLHVWLPYFNGLCHGGSMRPVQVMLYVVCGALGFPQTLKPINP